MQILIGADPEVFVRNPNHGRFVSAHGLIKGTKAQPHPVDYGAVQVDGMALEFNITPSKDADDFVHNISMVYDSLKRMVPGYQLVAEPVAVFDQDYFNRVPDEAKELGCDPDYNAWTGDVNAPPATDAPFRTASGHLHVGWTNGADPFSTEHFEDCRSVVKQLDYALGIHSLLWDQDNTRRSLYGKAGAFRPKEYGVEYRVLSNRWVPYPLLQRWLDFAIRRAVDDLFTKCSYEDRYGDMARHIIDDNRTDWQDFFQFEMGYPLPPKIKEAA